jgi:hypothetical protein
MTRPIRRWGALVALLAMASTSLVIAPPASAAITSTEPAEASSLAAAMMQDPAQLTGATLTRPSTVATSAGISDAPISFFPTNGGTFGILSTGNALQANLPNANFPDGGGQFPDAGERSTSWNSLTTPGRGSAFDTTTLRIDLDLVATAQQNCLLLDFAFYSEEFAEWVGSTFNDAFLAQLDSNAWNVAADGTISAPGNFAFDPNTNPPRPVSVNASGPLTMSLANAAGTTYDGGTPLLQAATPATPGAHALYLTIFDAGDAIFDSTAFIDNIRWIRVQDPSVNCVPGAVTYNDPPVAEANGPYEVDEGSSVVFDAAGSSDPEGGALEHEWALDPAIQGSLDDPALAAPTFTGVDDSTGDATLTVFDVEGQSGSDTATVTVLNVAPSITGVSSPPGSVDPGSSVDVSAEFSDPGPLDTHEFEIDWGDGSAPSTGTAAAGALGASHAYDSPGTYSVTIAVTDDDGGSDSRVVTVEVAAGPTGTYVTGGGWIDSPPGAVTASPGAAGKANFGFVSPTEEETELTPGHIEFHVKAAGLRFGSTSADAPVVVSGTTASWQGSGRLNGVADHGFMVSIVDGHAPGGDGIDRFRIRIWDPAGVVVYDSQTGSPATAAATTPLAGGSIVMHAPEA